MPKIRRAGFVFFSWKGDHGPRHVHVYREGKLLVKWDLEAEKAMKGTITRKVLDVIRQLQAEGLL